jgi:hypothetical protein
VRDAFGFALFLEKDKGYDVVVTLAKATLKLFIMSVLEVNGAGLSLTIMPSVRDSKEKNPLDL